MLPLPLAGEGGGEGRRTTTGIVSPRTPDAGRRQGPGMLLSDRITAGVRTPSPQHSPEATRGPFVAVGGSGRGVRWGFRGARAEPTERHRLASRCAHCKWGWIEPAKPAAGAPRRSAMQLHSLRCEPLRSLRLCGGELRTRSPQTRAAAAAPRALAPSGPRCLACLRGRGRSRAAQRSFRPCAAINPKRARPRASPSGNP